MRFLATTSTHNRTCLTHTNVLSYAGGVKRIGSGAQYPEVTNEAGISEGVLFQNHKKTNVLEYIHMHTNIR